MKGYNFLKNLNLYIGNSILTVSRQLKREADRFLRRTALLDFLQKQGNVNFVGSYSYDLMVDGDIDIHVANSSMNKARSLLILNALIKANHFRGYVYYDFTVHRHAGFPRGYYIGLKTRFLGRKWKIDMWLLKKADTRSDQIGRLVKTNLNAKNKLAILRLKSLVKAKMLPLTSVDIYRAVFLEKIKSPADLKKYTKN